MAYFSGAISPWPRKSARKLDIKQDWEQIENDLRKAPQDAEVLATLRLSNFTDRNLQHANVEGSVREHDPDPLEADEDSSEVQESPKAKTGSGSYVVPAAYTSFKHFTEKFKEVNLNEYQRSGINYRSVMGIMVSFLSH